MTTQILLVSAQAAPNLLPALDPELKPTDAVLLVSATMTARADALQSVLKEVGIKTRRIALDNEHNFQGLQEALLNIAAENDGKTIALNLTGGTKLMALAAQSIAVEAGWSMFYVDVDTDEVIYLGDGSPKKPHKLTEQLRLRHYLGAYGFTFQEAQRPEASANENEIIKSLLLTYDRYEKALGMLNAIGQKSEDDRKLTVQLTDEQADSKVLDDLLKLMGNEQMLEVNERSLTYTSAATRDFTKGGWLELHVFQTITGLNDKLGIRDRACNLEVTGGNVTNEFDVAFLCHNRLHVIECKTARMNINDGEKANQALFKLAENCRRIGGLGTRGMFVSYRDLRPNEKQLAKALGIEVVQSREIARLSEKLRAWVSPSRH